MDILPSRDLGNSSFVVGDQNRQVAAVIDPTRDTGRYLEHIETAGLSLEWVLETHLHADFVSGGAELARLGGATLGISAEAETKVSHRPLQHGEMVTVGSARITVIKSPGHTPEHVSFLLGTEDGPRRVLFSGGSLMAGTAGRPDLLGPGYTYQLVREEFSTLHERYADLPGALTVFPTHIGGSFCGVGTRPTARTTLGLERRTNPLLRARDHDAFLSAYLSSDPFPSYYRTDRRMNQVGGRPIGREIPDLDGLTPNGVERVRLRPGTTILDIREPAAFDKAHLPMSLSVPIDGAFSAWVGWLRPAGEEFVIVDDSPTDRRAAQIELLRIGYDNLKGHLDGGVAAYARAGYPIATTPRMTMAAVRQAIEGGKALTLVDARNPGEVARGGVPGSVNLPLSRLPAEALMRLDRTLPVYVHCQSGWRAAIAASVLEQLGFPRVVHVVDGPDAWKRSRAPASRHRNRG